MQGGNESQHDTQNSYQNKIRKKQINMEKRLTLHREDSRKRPSVQKCSSNFYISKQQQQKFPVLKYFPIY